MTNGPRALVYVEGEPDILPAEVFTKGVLKTLKRNYPHKGRDIYIPEEAVRVVVQGPPRCADCLLVATDGYMSRVLGIGLDRFDREFFNRHGLVRPEGVPEQSTFRVVQELVEPYGLRISRVRVCKDSHVRGDMLQWQNILRVNPLGLSDQRLSNAEFAEVTGQPLGTVDTDFRFEYSDEPMRPAIMCSADGQEHAEYRGPRGPSKSDAMQIRVDRGVVWHKEPVFPEVAVKEDVRRILLSSIELPNGKTLFGTDKKICSLCHSIVLQYKAGTCCWACWITFVKFWSCRQCGISFGKSIPELIEADLPNELAVRCSKCKVENVLEDDGTGDVLGALNNETTGETTSTTYRPQFFGR